MMGLEDLVPPLPMTLHSTPIKKLKKKTSWKKAEMVLRTDIHLASVTIWCLKKGESFIEIQNLDKMKWEHKLIVEEC